MEQANLWDAQSALLAWVRDRSQRVHVSERGWLLAIEKAATLPEALSAAGWGTIIGENGDLAGIACNRETLSASRLPDLYAALEPIAPFVRPGSYIVLWRDDAMIDLYEATLRFDRQGLRIEKRRV